MILENLKQIIYSILGFTISSYISLGSALGFKVWRLDDGMPMKPCICVQAGKNNNCKQQAFRDREKNDVSAIIYDFQYKNKKKNDGVIQKRATKRIILQTE